MSSFIQKSILILLISMSLGCSRYPSFSTFMHNQKAKNQIEKGNFSIANNEIISAFKNDPFLPELHFNLGLVLDGNKQGQEAVSSYNNALKYFESQHGLFATNFNLAELNARGKNIDQALKYYQEALKFYPNSKEVKTNIELLIRQQQEQQKNKQSDQGENNQDQKQDQKDQQGKNDQKQDQQNDQKDKEKDQKEKEQPKQYSESAKYKPREFKGEELNEADVKKILEEIRQQEKKIRAKYNEKNMKESTSEKDW